MKLVKISAKEHPPSRSKRGRKADPLKKALKLLRRAKPFVRWCETMMEDEKSSALCRDIIDFLKEQKPVN